MSIIQVRDLSIQYAGGRKSVKECSFVVQEGEVFGLLGSNGAGKSTILMAFAGLIKNFRGDVTIMGNDCRFSSGINRDVAYVPQSPCLFFDFTVRENLHFFCSMEGLGGDERESKIKELLSKFYLEGFADMAAGRLSGGYRQLLNIALSSVLDKKIVLMDEPTAGLDLWSKKKVGEHIRELKSRGKTVVLTTHDLADAESLCDNVVILSDGRVLANGNIRSLLRDFGGGYTISVSLSNKIPKVLPLAYSKVISISAQRLVLETNQADIGPAITELVSKLGSAGIEDLEVREPSLGYVFSNLLSKVKA